MSWEERFANIVMETEMNISNLQKRLGGYVCPVTPCSLIDESVARLKDIDPYCKMFLPPPTHRCFPSPCGPCPIHTCNITRPLCQYTDQKQEIEVLRRHVRDLEADNDLQKKKMKITECPPDESYRTKSSFAGSRSETPGYRSTTPPEPCSVAIELRDMFQRWQQEITQRVTGLQTQVANQENEGVSIKQTNKSVDGIKKDLIDLRNYVSGEVSDVRHHLNLVKKNLENVKNSVVAIEATSRANEQNEMKGAIESLAPRQDREQDREQERQQERQQERRQEEDRKSIQFAQPADTSFSEELMQTVNALKEQVRLMEDYVYGRGAPRGASIVPPIDSVNTPIVPSGQRYSTSSQRYSSAGYTATDTYECAECPNCSCAKCPVSNPDFMAENIQDYTTSIDFDGGNVDHGAIENKAAIRSGSVKSQTYRSEKNVQIYPDGTYGERDTSQKSRFSIDSGKYDVSIDFTVDQDRQSISSRNGRKSSTYQDGRKMSTTSRDDRKSMTNQDIGEPPVPRDDRKSINSQYGRGTSPTREASPASHSERRSISSQHDREPSPRPEDRRVSTASRADRKSISSQHQREPSPRPEDRRPSTASRVDRKSISSQHQREPSPRPEDRRPSTDSHADRKSISSQHDGETSLKPEDRRPSTTSRADRKSISSQHQREPSPRPEDRRPSTDSRADRKSISSQHQREPSPRPEDRRASTDSRADRKSISSQHDREPSPRPEDRKPSVVSQRDREASIPPDNRKPSVVSQRDRIASIPPDERVYRTEKTVMIGEEIGEGPISCVDHGLPVRHRSRSRTRSISKDRSVDQGQKTAGRNVTINNMMAQEHSPEHSHHDIPDLSNEEVPVTPIHSPASHSASHPISDRPLEASQRTVTHVIDLELDLDIGSYSVAECQSERVETANLKSEKLEAKASHCDPLQIGIDTPALEKFASPVKVLADHAACEEEEPNYTDRQSVDFRVDQATPSDDLGFGLNLGNNDIIPVIRPQEATKTVADDECDDDYNVTYEQLQDAPPEFYSTNIDIQKGNVDIGAIKPTKESTKAAEEDRRSYSEAGSEYGTSIDMGVFEVRTEVEEDQNVDISVSVSSRGTHASCVDHGLPVKEGSHISNKRMPSISVKGAETGVTFTEQRERSQSPSVASTQKQDRSRSTSINPPESRGQSRSPSINPAENRGQSRSASINPPESRGQSRSSSFNPPESRERSRSPSVNPAESRERSRSPSVPTRQERGLSTSAPSTARSEQVRTQSESSTTKHVRSRSPSVPISMRYERDQSPSPAITKPVPIADASKATIGESCVDHGTTMYMTKQQIEGSRVDPKSPSMSGSYASSVMPLTDRSEVGTCVDHGLTSAIPSSSRASSNIGTNVDAIETRIDFSTDIDSGCVPPSGASSALGSNVDGRSSTRPSSRASSAGASGYLQSDLGTNVDGRDLTATGSDLSSNVGTNIDTGYASRSAGTNVDSQKPKNSPNTYYNTNIDSGAFGPYSPTSSRSYESNYSKCSLASKNHPIDITVSLENIGTDLDCLAAFDACVDLPIMLTSDMDMSMNSDSKPEVGCQSNSYQDRLIPYDIREFQDPCDMASIKSSVEVFGTDIDNTGAFVDLESQDNNDSPPSDESTTIYDTPAASDNGRSG